MKEEIQLKINKIKVLAGSNPTVGAAHKGVVSGRPDNALSRSIMNEKEADQFRAELRAAVDLGRIR